MHYPKRNNGGPAYNYLKVGLPTAVQMVIVNISYTLITGMLNIFGVSIAAAAGIAMINAILDACIVRLLLAEKVARRFAMPLF